MKWPVQNFFLDILLNAIFNWVCAEMRGQKEPFRTHFEKAIEIFVAEKQAKQHRAL